jgi:hypothetical protein
MQAADEYRKAIENQIVMIEEILSRFAEGNWTWQQPDDDEWRNTTEETIRRLEEDLAHFRSVREELDKANRKNETS